MFLVTTVVDNAASEFPKIYFLVLNSFMYM